MANISLPMHPPMLPAVIRQARFQLTHFGPEVDSPSPLNVRCSRSSFDIFMSSQLSLELTWQLFTYRHVQSSYLQQTTK